MLRTGLIVLLCTFRAKSGQYSKKRGKLMQLWKEKAIIALILTDKGKLQLHETSPNIL